MKDPLREQPVIVVVKKKGGHGGHHGGAWKVAFADFMTALMAMFLVLWIVGQSSDVKSAIAGYFQDPLGRADQFGSSIMSGTGAPRPTLTSPLTPEQINDPRIDRLRAFASHVQAEIEQIPEFAEIGKHVVIEIVEEGVRISLLEDSVGVFFETGSAAPHPSGQAILRLLGRELAKMPSPVVIEGHTDARPYASGARYTNWELSADRANSARRALVDGGLRSEQMEAVRGLADRNLRIPSDPMAPENRRITITLLDNSEILERPRLRSDSTNPAGASEAPRPGDRAPVVGRE